MQTVEHLSELFRYNDWANRRIVVALKDNECEPARRILAHLVTTEQEYFERLYGKDSTGFDFWPDLALTDCGTYHAEIAEHYEKLIRGFDEDGLDIVDRYHTSEGSGMRTHFAKFCGTCCFIRPPIAGISS